jgi:formamidopyrimidine-DNA glycosylase
MKIVDADNLKKIKNNYGIEPLTSNFKFSEFKKVFFKKKINVKALLLNQKLLSGIGNIYADEILFDANINPKMAAGKLLIKQIEAIYRSVKKIIKKAIKHRGTTFSDYRDTSGRKGNFSRFLRVYGREGEKCVKCGNPIKKIKLGGRGTRFCEKCQK